MSSPNAKPLRIGVLFSDSVQLLDIAGIDLFGMLSPSYLEVVNLPPQIVELGVPSEIHYIGPSSTSTGRCTANVTINLTDTVSSPPVSPGNLDILMIPGPLPSHIPSDEVKAFVRGHHEAGTTILTICTGCLIAAQAGIFDGKRVSGPRGLISMFRERFPNVKEWNDTQRFVRDGNIWSSGGMTNGIDLIVGYLRANFPAPLVEVVCALAEVGDRSLAYGRDAYTKVMSLSE